jgi:hypothetical protein
MWNMNFCDATGHMLRVAAKLSYQFGEEAHMETWATL